MMFQYHYLFLLLVVISLYHVNVNVWEARSALFDPFRHFIFCCNQDVTTSFCTFRIAQLRRNKMFSLYSNFAFIHECGRETGKNYCLLFWDPFRHVLWIRHGYSVSTPGLMVLWFNYTTNGSMEMMTIPMTDTRNKPHVHMVLML